MVCIDSNERSLEGQRSQSPFPFFFKSRGVTSSLHEWPFLVTPEVVRTGGNEVNIADVIKARGAMFPVFLVTAAARVCAPIYFWGLGGVGVLASARDSAGLSPSSELPLPFFHPSSHPHLLALPFFFFFKQTTLILSIFFTFFCCFRFPSFVRLLAYQGIADDSDDFLLVCSGDRLLKEFGVPFLASVKVALDLELDWRERRENTLHRCFLFFLVFTFFFKVCFMKC